MKKLEQNIREAAKALASAIAEGQSQGIVVSGRLENLSAIQISQTSKPVDMLEGYQGIEAEQTKPPKPVTTSKPKTQ